MRTDKQDKFIEHYCLTGNATQSAVNAGYSPKTAEQMGYKLKNQFSREIDERIKKRLRDNVPSALCILGHLAESAESESVKLGAVKDILDRAGYKPAERVQQEISHVEGKTTEELQKELEALIGPLN